MIPKISSKSNIADVSTTAIAIENEVNEFDFSTDLYLTTLLGTFSDYNTKLTEAIKEKLAYSVLGEKDEKRDFALRGVFYQIRAFMFWPDAEVVAAASAINTVLEKYGIDSTHLSFAEESANINAMLADMKKPENVAHITKLPNQEALNTALNTTQTEFEASSLEYMQAQTEQKKQPSATALRNQTRDLINKDLSTYLNTMSKVNSELYGAAAEVITTIIEHNNATVRNRYNSDKSEETE